MSIREPIELIRSYATAGIAGAATINSGALVALLSQVGDVPSEVLSSSRRALMLWAIGVAIATVAWWFSYLSVLAFAHSKPVWERTWASVASVLFLASVAMFLLGFRVVVRALA